MLPPLARSAAAILLVVVSTPLFADVLPTSRLPWAFSGDVYVARQDGNTLYVGGGLFSVAPAANAARGFVELTGGSATPRVPFPPITNGNVVAIADDGAGGWFIGGDFTAIGAAARTFLARLRADGTLDPSFAPSLSGHVRALVRVGSVLYVGGRFVQVNGVTRLFAAALDVATGALQPWNPATDGEVVALAASGNRIYLGGNFGRVGGGNPSAAFRLAAVSAATGAVETGFFAGVQGDAVLALHATGAALYVGGSFTGVNGVARSNLAAVNLATGAVLPFLANTNGRIDAMASDGTQVFVAGAFTEIGGHGRSGVAAVHPTTGSIGIWDPQPAGGSVTTIAVGGSEVFIGGSFTRLGGERREHIGSVPATGSGHPALPWNPGLSGAVTALAAAPGGGAAAGGAFTHYRARGRTGLAALDVITGELLPLAPEINGFVLGLAIVGHTVYIGGDFTAVDGQTRTRLAAVDVRTGAVLPWDPRAGAIVETLAAFGPDIYVGGMFVGIGGVTRPYLASVNAQTGIVTSWNPAVNARVMDLEVAGTTLYVGGAFSQLAGQPRNRLASVDLTTLAATTFNPNVVGLFVTDLSVEGPDLFFSGTFTQVGGQSRSHAAAVDRTTAAVRAFAPAVNASVGDIEVIGNTAYLAGPFSAVNGVSRNRFAAVSADTGGITRPFDFGLTDGSIIALQETPWGLIAVGQGAVSGVSPPSNLLFLPEAAMTGIPGPPSQPAATVSGNSIVLTWTPAAIGGTPTDYLIEAAAAPGGLPLAVISNGSANPMFGAVGVPSGLYFARVRARNGFGVSLPSPEVGVVLGNPQCTGPPLPPDLAAAVNGLNVTLTWPAAVGRTSSYLLRVGRAEGVADIGTFDVGRGPTFGAVTAPGAYFTRLVAVGPCGWSAPSGSVVVPVLGVTPPPPPFATSQVVGSTVTIAWSAVPGAVGYQLLAGSGPLLSNVAIADTNSTSLVATGVPAGTYYVRVRAVTVGGLSSTSRELAVVVP